jgi:hypothetical protein
VNTQQEKDIPIPMKHIKKSKKNIMIGSAIAGTTLVASGVVAGIVLSIQPANNKPATEITMKNVYSIRDYLLRRYAKVLTDQGDSAEYIQQQIQKIKENVDQIVAEGVVGGFPPQTIYGSIYQYGSSLNITVID